MRGTREVCCDGDKIMKSCHPPSICEDSEDNVESCSMNSEKCTCKKLMDSRAKWLCKCQGVYKKRKLARHKVPLPNAYPCWHFENKLSKLSLDNLDFCQCYEQHKANARLSSSQMDRAVGIVYPCLMDDKSRNKRKLRSTTNLQAGKKLKEVTTVYRRECNMSSISTTTDSGMLSSSAKAHRERVKQVPSAKLKYNTPETLTPDSLVENSSLIEKITPYKKDNTGYFEFVSPSDDCTTSKKVHKHGSHTKYKEEKKTKTLLQQHMANAPQSTQTAVLCPILTLNATETSKEKKFHKCRHNKQLTPIIENKMEQLSQESTFNNTVTTKSYHSIIRKKPLINNTAANENENSVAQLHSEPIHYGYFEVKRYDSKVAPHKEDVKKVSFMELDKYPTKINKEIDTKHLMRTTTKDKSLATNSSDCMNDVKMEDKSLTVHISESMEDHKLSPSVTRILNELLLDPEHAKVIKKVLHSLARKAALRRSLSNTILELKAKENKLGILKRKSSGSIQNVSSSDLERLHFERYKASVDVAIKMLEDRMTRKIHEAVRNREKRRKHKEEKEKRQKEGRSYSGDRESVKDKSRHVKYNFLQNKSSTDVVTVDSKDLDERSSLPSFRDCQLDKYNSDFSSVNSIEHLAYDFQDFDFPERPYPIEDPITTFAYNVHVNPSSTNPFRKIHSQGVYDAPASTRVFQPLRNAFSIPRHIDVYQARSNTSYPTPNAIDSPSSTHNVGEGGIPVPTASQPNMPLRDDIIKEAIVSAIPRTGLEAPSSRESKHSLSKTNLGITKSSARLSNTMFSILEDAEETNEMTAKALTTVHEDLHDGMPVPSRKSIDVMNEGILRGLRFQDIQVFRSETSSKKGERNRGKEVEIRDSPVVTDPGYKRETTPPREFVYTRNPPVSKAGSHRESSPSKENVFQRDSGLPEKQNYDRESRQANNYQTVSNEPPLPKRGTSPMRGLSPMFKRNASPCVDHHKESVPSKDFVHKRESSPPKDTMRESRSKDTPRQRESAPPKHLVNQRDSSFERISHQESSRIPLSSRDHSLPRDQFKDSYPYHHGEKDRYSRNSPKDSGSSIPREGVTTSASSQQRDSSPRDTSSKESAKTKNVQDSPTAKPMSDGISTIPSGQKLGVLKYHDDIPNRHIVQTVLALESAATSPRSKKSAHFSKPEENQVRLPAIRESKESNAMAESPDKNGSANKRKVADVPQFAYGKSQSSERVTPTEGANHTANESFDKTDTLYKNVKYSAANPAVDTSGSPSTDSTAVTNGRQEGGRPPMARPPIPTTRPNNGLKTPAIEEQRKSSTERDSNSDDKRLSTYGQDRLNNYYYNGQCPGECPPYYEEGEELDEYDDLLPDYYYDYDCCMRSCTDCPRRSYYDTIPRVNRVNPRKYPSSHGSRESRPHDPASYNYDFAGPVYSERIRYTCRRVQGGDGANLISFVVFLILFIGLFQYLNMNIH